MPGNTAKSEDVQKIILALLVSQKNSVPLGHLDRDYKEQEGECIPWKELGYISLFDYLKSMPKYFHLERINGMYYVRGIASEKSKHVSLLVARQKSQPKKPPYARRTYKPSCYYPKTQHPRIQLPSDILTDIIYAVRENPNGVNKEYILKRVKEKLPYVNYSVMDLDEQFKDLSHELFVEGNLVFPTISKSRFIPQKSSESSDMSIKKEETLQSQNVTLMPKYAISGDSDSELNIDDIDDDNDFSFVPSDNTSNKCNENDKNITMSKKKQPISMFIQETVSKHHIQDDKLNDKFKYNTTENELYYKQNNTIERECQGDLNYHIDDESAKLLINERTRFRLEKLIQKYPDGIWCAELPEKFLQEYDRPLNYIELGFNSVREFASYLPEIFQCKQLHSSGDFILYNAKHKLMDAKEKDAVKSKTVTDFSQYYQEEDEIQALPSIVSSNTSNKLMPDGVMVIGETVGQISVIDLESRLQPYVEVFVEEVFTPSLFWVQLRKKKKLFNKLMEDLHIFYENKSTLYKIPLLVIEKGLNCACVYNNQWHRGIIKQVKPDLEVTVMFYDYGTLKTYPPEAIFYLHRSFSYLPAQAIPCGLYNTKPCIGDQWSRGVTHEFAFRTTQKPLIATIVSTDPENNSMLVTLTDTMEEEDVHINDWLVQQNLALHGKMGDVVDMSNIMLFVEENLLHHADKCYGKDYLISNSKNTDDSIESLVNIPLISPQSTLNEKPTKLASQLPLPTESPNLLTFLQGNSMDNNKSILNPFVSVLQTDQDIQSNKKFSTNPFLDSMDTCQDHVNNLSSEMFMQIWETNLRLQMQIISIFNILIAKLDTTSKKVNNYSLKNETRENYEQRLLYASELLENIILKEDVSSLLEFKPTNCFANMKFDATSNRSNETFMPSFSSSTNYATSKLSEINDNSISKALLEYLKQIDDRNGITSNSTTQDAYNRSSYQGHDINAFKYSPVVDNITIETSAFQGQNSFIHNKMDHFHTMWSKQYNEMKDNGFNETNPFKVLLELKDNKWNNSNENQTSSLNTEFEKYCSSSDTNYHFGINNIDNHMSSIQHDYISFTNKSVLNPFNSESLSTNQKDSFRSFQNSNNVTLQSEMVSQNTAQDQYRFKEKCNIPHENSGASLSPDYNYCNTYSPIFKSNNAEHLTNSEFSTLDELVKPNIESLWSDKSNNRPNSPIFKKLLNEIDIQEAQFHNFHRSSNISAETWIRDAENSILLHGKFKDTNDIKIQDSCSHQRNVDLELRYGSNREYINADKNRPYFSKENYIDSKIYNENLQINTDKKIQNDTECIEQLLKNDHEDLTINMTSRIDAKEIDIPYYEFLISTSTSTELNKLFLQTVEIRSKTFCIFHFEDEGWLLLDNFVEEFTPCATISEYYKQLQISNIDITFKKISRSESPLLFFQLDNMQVNVSRDRVNNVNDINLMPLKSIIAVLAKLRIVTRAEVNDVIIKREFKQYLILKNVWILISTYGKLRSLIKNNTKSKKV